MLRNILIYGFPLFLLLLESIMRAALQIDSSNFVGPTLAGVGIGFALPLTAPKDIADEFHHNTQRVLHRRNAIVFDRREWRFVELVWIFVFVFVACWCFSLYYSATSQDYGKWQFWLSTLFGVFNYIASICLSVVKENSLWIRAQ